MARTIAEGAKSVEGVDVELNDSVSPETLSDFDAIIVGTPTYRHNMVDEIEDFLIQVASRPYIILEGKIGAAFGSYGWTGEAPKMVIEVLKNKFGMRVSEPPLLVRYAPNQEAVQKCHEFGKRIAETFVRQI
jgi:flavorubredoxin